LGLSNQGRCNARIAKGEHPRGVAWAAGKHRGSAPHVHGILRDINEFGIAYEIVYEGPYVGRIIFVPWHRIEEIHLDRER
jgi:hypothetical protein